MSFELEDEDSILIIDLDNRSFKGYCKGWKGVNKQMKQLKQILGG